MVSYYVTLYVILCSGVGVGGEYPMASSSAAERAEGDRALRRHRGRQVCLTFSQQVGSQQLVLLLAQWGEAWQARS